MTEIARLFPKQNKNKQSETLLFSSINDRNSKVYFCIYIVVVVGDDDYYNYIDDEGKIQLYV
jgi:hypothetical protein